MYHRGGFPMLIILWCLGSQTALKACICSSHKENLQTDIFSEK